MKTAIFLLFVFLVCFAGCSKDVVRQNTAGQIISNSWEGENELAEKDKWIPLTPPVIITMTDTGNVTALYVGEFIARPGTITDPDTHNPVELIGVPVRLRIKVDDKVAAPSGVQITATPYYETRSFLASYRDLLPGTHTIIAEWNSESTGAKIRNRAMTVWETVTP
ncbi:MAG TPA: hypothetical protein VGK25_11850 [Ignavibacteria bacterium]